MLAIDIFLKFIDAISDIENEAMRTCVRFPCETAALRIAIKNLDEARSAMLSKDVFTDMAELQ